MTVVAFVVCGIALLGSATMAAADKSVAKPPAGVPVSGVPVGGGGQVVAESLKVVVAVKPEDWPVAVNLSVVPMRSSVNTYHVVWKPPWVSAVTLQGSYANPAAGPSTCTTWLFTISPG